VKVQWNERHRLLTSPYRQPAILQVNQESRYEGLKIYQKCPANSLERAQIYLNYDIDTIFFDWKSFDSAELIGFNIAKEEIAKIQRVLVYSGDTSGFLLHANLEEFTSLRYICCVQRKERCVNSSKDPCVLIEAF
jgi:hypothetical protein